MIQAFNAFDKDGNGLISLEEFQEMMTKLGEKLTAEEIEDQFHSADIDGDEHINFEEFTRMLTQ